MNGKEPQETWGSARKKPQRDHERRTPFSLMAGKSGKLDFLDSPLTVTYYSFIKNFMKKHEVMWT